MTEFKQIIGRGTRVRDDYGKLFFNILDYTGSATRCSPTPTSTAIRLVIDRGDDRRGGRGRRAVRGRSTTRSRRRTMRLTSRSAPRRSSMTRPTEDSRRKYYVDGGSVEIAADLVYELDADGKQLRVVKLHRLHRREGAHALHAAPSLREPTGPTPKQRSRHHSAAGRARHRLRRAGAR